ncbi:hypothetical protein M2454_000172 [Aequitasia blattaphilus]|uniref:Immunity protein 30 domain-containing protein n=1 Tax=Aequitasia blattaphilus TaxID=2949332 RepID=A0ABT1E533_9FIRM|nr:hypothetical protein [Aequitasia blattaphilus]MCP1100954.1 hypothetical protein [Aequitasia blattaphilus]MCR8613594.1 hypothetical protein [Aequitasia blattaphilus]
MDLDYMLLLLEDKDTSKAFEALKELELMSDDTAILYPYIDKFVEMIGDKKYVIRVRGFRLFCKQAQWDSDGVIDENIEEALCILNDEKPTAVRQALASLKDLVLYKEELRDIVKEKVLAIDYYKYKDTMHSLIAKDIDSLLEAMLEK